MKRVCLMMVCLVMAVCGVALDAGAYTIDFEPLTHDNDDTGKYFSSYTEGGYLISNYDLAGNLADDLTAWGTAADGAYAGSTALFTDGYDYDLTVLTALDGGTFSVSSIDLSELSTYNSESFDVTFTGLLADGATIRQSFSLNGTFGFERFTFSDDFSDLLSLSWELEDVDYGFQLDNVVVNATNPVPVPAAILLLGSGLVGVMEARRRTILSGNRQLAI